MALAEVISQPDVVASVRIQADFLYWISVLPPFTWRAHWD